MKFFEILPFLRKIYRIASGFFGQLIGFVQKDGVSQSSEYMMFFI